MFPFNNNLLTNKIQELLEKSSIIINIFLRQVDFIEKNIILMKKTVFLNLKVLIFPN